MLRMPFVNSTKLQSHRDGTIKNAGCPTFAVVWLTREAIPSISATALFLWLELFSLPSYFAARLESSALALGAAVAIEVSSTFSLCCLLLL